MPAQRSDGASPGEGSPDEGSPDERARVGRTSDQASRGGCVARILGALHPGEVLDVACGGGEFTEVLIRHLPGFRRIIGVDPDKDSLDEARLLVDDRRVSFVQATVEESSYQKGRFGLVSISNALHHLSRPREALRKIWRFVRRRGHLLVHEMVSDGLTEDELTERDLHHMKARIDRLAGKTHNYTFTEAELYSLVSAACRSGDTNPGDTNASDSNPPVTRCIATSPPRSTEESRYRVAFLREYAGHVDDYAVRGDLLRSLDDLEQRVERHGMRTPRRLVLLVERR